MAISIRLEASFVLKRGGVEPEARLCFRHAVVRLFTDPGLHIEMEIDDYNSDQDMRDVSYLDCLEEVQKQCR